MGESAKEAWCCILLCRWRLLVEHQENDLQNMGSDFKLFGRILLYWSGESFVFTVKEMIITYFQWSFRIRFWIRNVSKFLRLEVFTSVWFWNQVWDEQCVEVKLSRRTLSYWSGEPNYKRKSRSFYINEVSVPGIEIKNASRLYDVCFRLFEKHFWSGNKLEITYRCALWIHLYVYIKYNAKLILIKHLSLSLWFSQMWIILAHLNSFSIYYHVQCSFSLVKWM